MTWSFYDSNGVLQSGGSGGGATAALDNLASVAINTSLISDTDNTDDLGSSAAKWKDSFLLQTLFEERTAPGTPTSGDVALYAKTDGLLYSKDDAGAETLVSGAGGTDYLEYTHEETSGTDGGTATSGSYETRTMNTEVADPEGHGSLASNQITLAAGTYRFWAWAALHQTNISILRLQDVDTPATLAIGSHFDMETTGNEMGTAVVAGRFTLSVSRKVELQSRVQTTQANTGFGWSNSFGGNEIYARVILFKE